MKKILPVFLPICILILLFTHPIQTTEGCAAGLLLWYSAVLPSLLPFLIVSSVMMKTGLFHSLTRLYAPVCTRIFRISESSCYAVLMGYLCGFPMGAKVIADLVRDQHISAEEGTYLLGFCNNVSPSFFINYVCLKHLGFTDVPWKLCLLFYALPLIYGIASRPFYHFSLPSQKEKKEQARPHRITFPILDACIMDSFATVTRIGGYLILFSILVQLLQILPLPESWILFSSACLELSCGIHRLSMLPASLQNLKLCGILSCASFGGLSICAQTCSVLHDTPLSIRSWLIGRIILTILTPLLLLLH